MKLDGEKLVEWLDIQARKSSDWIQGNTGNHWMKSVHDAEISLIKRTIDKITELANEQG